MRRPLVIVSIAVLAVGCRTGSEQQALPTPAPAVRLVGCDAAEKELRIARASGEAKRVALTFDDGPDRYTARVLDVLREKRARATFFVVGKFVDAQPTLVRRELREGHSVGNHTYSHARVDRADRRANEEIERTTEAIESAAGFTPCLFRAPAGKESRALYELVRARGMTTIYSSVDPRDWDPSTTADEIVTRVLAEIEPGSIVLMHDGFDSEPTLEALPRVIDGLRADGYELVTVNELLDIPLVYR